jgi:uncharacterized protein
MNALVQSKWLPIVLLCGSNIFMTFAWYGHLKHKSAPELKIIQEVITLTVFAGFAIFYLGERIRWNHCAAFRCILAAVAFTFIPRSQP